MYAAPDPSRESAALREVEKQAGAVADECAVARAGGNGLRCVAARPDGKELVVGDGCGNVRVFDLGSRTERLRLAAHDAEVLSVAYGPNACADDTAVRTSASSPDSTGFPFVDTAEAPEQRLVSSGRDGLVHIYDASLNSDGSPGVYRLEDTVDDHDAAVTGAVIAGLGSECKLVTTGADRKVIFRNLAPLSRVKKSQSKASKASKAFASETMPRGVVHGVALDTRGKTCVTAGADGRLRLWSIANGKTTRAYPCADEGAGEALRVDADPHGRFAAVSHADKTVRVYDVKSGVLVGRCVGHGTAVTALAFMNCGSRLVTGGADGTVCVWRLPGHLGLSPPARAPLRAVTNVSAAKCAVLVGTHDGSLREHAGVNDRYANAAPEPSLVVKSVTGDPTDADPALMNASGASSIPSLAFDELPKWAARAAANASNADESEKREMEKLDNLAKVAAGSKWSANAPGGYVPKRTGLSASVLDHGDVDLEVDDDDDVDVENENSPENAAEKENAHPIAPGSVVSLYTPLDDDDDALYYAESEPGGDGSVPGTFGVVTVSPAHEQKSEHGLAAVDEREAPAEGAEGADTAVPTNEDAPAPDTMVQEDAAKPKGVFARVAAMLGGKKPASHLKTQPQDVQHRSRFRRRVPNPRGPSRRPVTAATGSTYLRAAMTTGKRRRLRRSTRRSLTMNHRRCHSRFASTTTTSLWANTQTTTRRNRRENKRRTRRFAIASPGGSGVVRANPSRCTSSSTPRAYPTTSPRTRTRTRTMVGGCRLATWSPRLKPSSGRMRIAPPPPPVSRRVLHQRCAHPTPALTRTRTWCVRVWRSFARHFPVSGRPLLNARARHPSRRR